MRLTRQPGTQALAKVQHSPAFIYLARFTSKHSVINLRHSLDVVAGLLSRGVDDAFSFDWPSLRYGHLATVRSHLQAEGFASSTVNRHIAAVRGVLKECWRLGLMTSEEYHRARDVELARGRRLPPGRALKHRELRALYEACEEEPRAKGSRNAALLSLLYGAGLRRSEVVALSFRDWNSEESSLRIHGKGGNERVVYINNGSLDAFEAWLEIRGEGSADDPIFVAINSGGRLTGRRISPQTVFDMLRELQGKSGIAHFSPHDLRRSFISDLLEAGTDLAVVQKMAGHSSASITAAYDRRGEAAKVRAAARLTVPFTRRTE